MKTFYRFRSIDNLVGESIVFINDIEEELGMAAVSASPILIHSKT